VAAKSGRDLLATPLPAAAAAEAGSHPFKAQLAPLRSHRGHALSAEGTTTDSGLGWKCDL